MNVGMHDVMNGSAADMEVAPLAGTLPPHCRQDVETLRRFITHHCQPESAGETCISV